MMIFSFLSLLKGYYVHAIYVACLVTWVCYSTYTFDIYLANRIHLSWIHSFSSTLFLSYPSV